MISNAFTFQQVVHDSCLSRKYFDLGLCQFIAISRGPGLEIRPSTKVRRIVVNVENLTFTFRRRSVVLKLKHQNDIWHVRMEMCVQPLHRACSFLVFSTSLQLSHYSVLLFSQKNLEK